MSLKNILWWCVLQEEIYLQPVCKVYSNGLRYRL